MCVRRVHWTCAEHYPLFGEGRLQRVIDYKKDHNICYSVKGDHGCRCVYCQL